MLQAVEMAQRVKVLATKPGNLIFIVGTHMVDRELNFSGCLLYFSGYIGVVAHKTHTHRNFTN